MILIIGSEEEYHSWHIYNLLKAKEEEVCYFDSRKIPKDILINWAASNETIKGSLIIEGRNVNLEDIKSVYWRWYYGISIEPVDNKPESIFISQMVEREFISTIESLFASMDCLWVNSLNAVEMHRKKAYQLNILAKNGIRVPKTLITNNKDSLLPFFEANNGQLIYKPVRGGAHTEKINQEDFIDTRLNSLKYSPVQFQEFIDGVDIRVYVIGNKVFAAKIKAKTVDFRSDPEAELIPVELPDNIKEDCFKIMGLLDLKFSGIDIRQNKDGEYVFIEANPSPMFTFFEEKTGFPISGSLIKMLIKGNCG
ncbi:MAG: hypothetical protein ACD_20C00334G0001 [uncultured bacterium]|nr:MAG: hypothetical protein ACD_20C00334G0001 [uncultured bacterium]